MICTENDREMFKDCSNEVTKYSLGIRDKFYLNIIIESDCFSFLCDLKCSVMCKGNDRGMF